MTIQEIHAAIKAMYPLDGPIRVHHHYSDFGEEWSAVVSDTTDTDFVAQAIICDSPEKVLFELKSELGWRSKSQPEPEGVL